MIFMQHQFTQITMLSKLTNLRITTLLVVYTVIIFCYAIVALHIGSYKSDEH